jgi:hypothetical protein
MSDVTSTKSADFVGNLGAAVRDNPLPAALIGMGLLWLLRGGRATAKAGFAQGVDAVSSLSLQAAGAARSVVGSVGDSANAAGGSLSDAGGAIMQRVSEVGGTAIRSMRPDLDFASARASIADLMQRQPLFIGAVGLAIGAGIAASIPPTAAEVDLLGAASANLQEKARDLAAATANQARELAGSVATTVANEARVQGLTVDELKQNATEVGRKVQSVIGASVDAARSRTN